MKTRLGIIIALLLLGVVALGQLALVDPQIPKSLQGRYVDVDGIQLRVYQQGAGDDVLLVHGLPGSIEDWAPVMDRLAKSYRVTAIDRVGHGFSFGDDARNHLLGNVDLVKALLETLDLNNPILVGHSYGGAIVLMLAQTQAASDADTIRGVVAVAPYLQSKPVDNIYRAMLLPGLGKGLAALGNPFMGPSMMTQGLSAAFFPGEIPQGFAEQRAPMWLTVKNSVATAREKVAFADDAALLVDFSDVSSPVWLIHGDQDKTVDLDDSRRAHQSLPSSELRVVPQGSHYIIWTHPDLVIEAVNSIAQQGLWSSAKN